MIDQNFLPMVAHTNFTQVPYYSINFIFLTSLWIRLIFIFAHTSFKVADSFSTGELILYFADDTKCLLSIRSTDDVSKFQSDVNGAAVWSLSLDLLFNEAKFVHVRFWAKPSFNLDTTTYTVNEKPIKQLSKHKDLGIVFSCNLNWTDHYMTSATKAYQILSLIRQTFRINCIEAKKHLYISLLRSQLMYCSQIWRPQLIRDITALERVQHRATKYILNDYISYKSRLLQLNLLPLVYIYELNF